MAKNVNVKEVNIPRGRSLSAAGVRVKRHPLVKADELVGHVFSIVGAFVLETRFGQRTCFDVLLHDGDGEVMTLMLAADAFRLSIVEAFAAGDGALGPLVLQEQPTSYGNPYWLITDYAEGEGEGEG